MDHKQALTPGETCWCGQCAATVWWGEAAENIVAGDRLFGVRPAHGARISLYIGHI
jgi:hypothetical protein